MMITAGVDLASLPERTAVCLIEWHDKKALVTSVELGADDARLTEVIQQADKTGIDVPFGWPNAFVEAVHAYSFAGRWPLAAGRWSRTSPSPSQAPKLFQYRATDRYVHERTDRWPLSVSADRIAIPAMRAAALFAQLSQSGADVVKDGSGHVVEVYPAAALRRWKFTADRYKRRSNSVNLGALLATFSSATADWLTISPRVYQSCEASDDAFDSVVAALVARAAAVGQCEEIPEECRPFALTEGWIALPKADSLGRIA